HITEELWRMLGNDNSVHDLEWIDFDEAALVKDEVEIVVQINGKAKNRIMIPTNLDKKDIERIALEEDKIKILLNGKTIIKVIVVPKKLVNIVVR
ncbi:MAG: class I tRNA ligase family protein, partial [Alkaliphilus sp.]